MRWLFLFLVACAPPLKFAVDPAFPSPDHDQITAAAAEWNRRTTGHPIAFDGTSWRVVRAAPVSGYNGWCDHSRRLIEIHPNPPGATIYAVALHEFGHALGLNHTEHGVMDPKHVTVEFSNEDMAECRRVGACK